MKKHYLFLGLLILWSSVSLFGQVRIGVKGGINIPNINASLAGVSGSSYKTELGLDAAVFVEIPLSETFSIQPMLEYAVQGAKRGGLQPVPIPDEFKNLGPFLNREIVYVDIKSQLDLNYLFFPLLLKAGWDFEMGSSYTENHYRFYVSGGPHIGYLASSKITLKDTFTGFYSGRDGKENLLGEGREVDVSSYKGINPTLDGEYELRKTNFGITGNAGIGYYFQDNAVFVELGGNIGFQSIFKSEIDNKRPGAVSISLGYSRRL